MKNGLILLFCIFAGPLLASEDHDAAREAVRQHKVIPLAEIVLDLTETFDARLLEAEFEREDGLHVYELELITSTGRMIEVMVDAATGEILEVEQEGWQEGND